MDIKAVIAEKSSVTYIYIYVLVLLYDIARTESYASIYRSVVTYLHGQL